MGEDLLEGESFKSAIITRVVVCGVPSPRARIAIRCSSKGGGCCRREALGISTLDSESSDRGSNPREVFRCIEVSIMRRGGLVPARFLHAFYGSCAGLR
jgi:hypothetical protein